MLRAVDPTDPFGGMADFVIDPETVALQTERQQRAAWQLRATNYEIALKQMQMALRSTPRKPKKDDLEHVRQLALDVVDTVLMEVG